jgi:hypothetical protein
MRFLRAVAGYSPTGKRNVHIRRELYVTDARRIEDCQTERWEHVGRMEDQRITSASDVIQ